MPIPNTTQKGKLIIEMVLEWPQQPLNDTQRGIVRLLEHSFQKPEYRFENPLYTFPSSEANKPLSLVLSKNDPFAGKNSTPENDPTVAKSVVSPPVPLDH